MNRSFRLIAALLVFLLCMGAAGCSASGGTSSVTSDPADTSASQPASSGKEVDPPVFGQITAIRENRVTMKLYAEIIPEVSDPSSVESTTSSDPVSSASSDVSSKTSSKATSSYLTVELFDPSKYQLTEKLKRVELEEEPCVLIPGEKGGWIEGTKADLMVGDSILIIEDIAAGKAVWRIIAAERPANSQPASSVPATQ